MATTKLYLDTRNKRKSQFPLKIAITHKSKTSLISLNVYLFPGQWDKKAATVSGHPGKRFLNAYIQKRKNDVDTIILKLIEASEIVRMDANDIKATVIQELSLEASESKIDSKFAVRFLKFAARKKPSTKQIYMHTYSRMNAFCDNLEQLEFENINKDWLLDFDRFLSKTSPSQNARNIHFRNIRAVFNDAIDDEITTHYPFRKFKIRAAQTLKRSLSAADLRTLFNYPVEPHAQKYLDMFKLTFFLIGINTIDLCRLDKINNGRIEYRRAKTGRLYSIKVEPEALELIEKYCGKKQLLDILDRYNNHRNYTKRINDNLQRIGKVERKGRGGKKVFVPLFPNLTTYWARHSWATIAAELDIPKETISEALGHSLGNPVTSIYINFNSAKIDEANRRVLDFVLYDKR